MIQTEMMRQLTALPRKWTPAAELTERETLALCIAAGAPTETVMEGGLLTVRTTVPCGVADRGDGGYIVAVGHAGASKNARETRMNPGLHTPL